MDLITSSFLKQFVEQNGLQELPEDLAFEHFCGFLATSRHHTASFVSEEIAVGEKGGDCGIDAIAMIINGRLVTEPEEVEALADSNGYLDATLVFTQAERSSGFETSKVGQFAFGVSDFLSGTPKLVQNERVRQYSAVWQELLRRCDRFRKGNPACFLYYATTGKWVGDNDLVARGLGAEADLRDLNVLREPRFIYLDRDELQRYYRETRNPVAADITFANRVTLPDLPGVGEAFLGFLPAPEFLKLIPGDGDEVDDSVFIDNVRHWQDWNAVNRGILETLESAEERVHFPLLNNGVTIVAKRLTSTGNRMHIEEYQIVNGCQTSFVLHEARQHLDESVLVPVRLIVTGNAELSASIVKATNRQTPVSEEQFLALLDFQRKLEDFFPAHEGKQRLYYERRSRQYAGDDAVEKTRIITRRDLIRAFASMFLERPHRTTRNFAGLLSTVGKEIFSAEHLPDPYYAAAYAHYRLEFLFRSHALPSELKKARYHLLLGFRLLVSPAKTPPLNSKEARALCVQLMDSLLDDDRCKTLFLQAAEIVREVAEGDMDRDHIRTEPFTDGLIAKLRPKTPKPESAAAPGSA